MKKVNYLNSVLTVIAVCLVMITLAITGLIPTASANDPISNKSSILESTAKAQDVNIVAINGNTIGTDNEQPLPVIVKK